MARKIVGLAVHNCIRAIDVSSLVLCRHASRRRYLISGGALRAGREMAAIVVAMPLSASVRCISSRWRSRAVVFAAKGDEIENNESSPRLEVAWRGHSQFRSPKSPPLPATYIEGFVRSTKIRQCRMGAVHWRSASGQREVDKWQLAYIAKQ